MRTHAEQHAHADAVRGARLGQTVGDKENLGRLEFELQRDFAIGFWLDFRADVVRVKVIAEPGALLGVLDRGVSGVATTRVSSTLCN